MQSNTLWPGKKRRPKLGKELRTDVAIIGAEIAGISIAHRIAEDGFDCAVLEKGEMGSGGRIEGKKDALRDMCSPRRFIPANG